MSIRLGVYFMKAYVLEKQGSIRIQEMSIPKITGDEVLVKMNNIGICGSDIHLFKGTYNGPFKYPMLFGHEWSGTVAGIGEKVISLKTGDTVTGDCSKYCGRCPACNTDRNLCENIEKFGITIDGASAEYIVRQEKYLYKAPVGLDSELVCLTEPISVAAHLIKKIIAIKPDITTRKIMIYGGGTIGISSLLLLKKKYGCEDVELYDIVREKCDLAAELGAVIPEKESLYRESDDTKYNAIYSSAAYDIVIETTGNANAFRSAINKVKTMGLVGCAGMISEVVFNQKLIVVKGLTLLGSIGGTGEFPEVLEFIKTNSENVKRLISHRHKMNEVDKVLSNRVNNVDLPKTLKIMMQM